MFLALCSGSLDECNSVIGMATASIATALPSLDVESAKRYGTAHEGRPVPIDTSILLMRTLCAS